MVEPYTIKNVENQNLEMGTLQKTEDLHSFVNSCIKIIFLCEKGSVGCRGFSKVRFYLICGLHVPNISISNGPFTLKLYSNN